MTKCWYVMAGTKIGWGISTALFTVNHAILLNGTNICPGLICILLDWFSFSLQDRECYVFIGKYICGVHQGFVLKPLLFNVNKCHLSIQNNSITYDHVEDDTQLYIALSLTTYTPIDLLHQCIY